MRSGKYAITDKHYNDADTVYVPNLDRFFKCEYVRNMVLSLDTLVVNGLDEMKFDLTIVFVNLIHLELSNVRITSPAVLVSPSLKMLLLSNATLNPPSQFHFGRLGLAYLATRLKYLRTTDILYEHNDELQFYREIYQSGAADELETLDCHLMNLRTLLYISNNFPALKNVYVRFGNRRENIIGMLDSGLDNLLKKLKPDLDVYYFGIPLTDRTAEVVENFFIEFGREMTFGSNTVCVKINSEWNTFNEQFGNHLDLLSGFFKLVDSLIFEDRLADPSILNRFTNVIRTTYRFWLDVRHGLPDGFQLYPNVKHIRLTSFPDVRYRNEILDIIPIHCTKLMSLSLDNWEADVDYRFLLNLSTIQWIRLYMRFAFDQTLCVELLERLTMLSYLEIWYEKTEDITKEQLSVFKHSVLDYINRELKYDEFSFRIQIHHRSNYFGNQKYSFVRILMKRSNRDCIYNSITASDDDVGKMMLATGYIREHPGRFDLN